jgi:hypothetical protein
MTKQQLTNLILNNHNKLKYYPGMETITKNWLIALDKIKGEKSPIYIGDLKGE